MIAQLDLNADQTSTMAVIDAEDHDAPVTVFAFSGAMKKVGGIPVFEFRNALKNIGADYNLVLIRDEHSSYYQVQPDGSPGGLDYYAACLQEIMSRLGAVYHVALGASMGATAALYFGARCRMHQVVAFGPNWPIIEDVNRRSRFKHLADLRALIAMPRGYWESLALMRTVALFYNRLRRKGIEVDAMNSAYRAAGATPAASVYYGSRCPYDVRCAQLLAVNPQVKLVPVETGMHNVAGFLKRKGILFRTIKDEIYGGFARTRSDTAVSPVSTNQLGSPEPIPARHG